MLLFNSKIRTSLIKKNEDIVTKKLKRQALFFGVFCGFTWLLELTLSYFEIFDSLYVTLKFSPIVFSFEIGMRLIGVIWIFLSALQLRLNLLLWLFFILFSPVLASLLISLTSFSEDEIDDSENQEDFKT
jgi:hypothetical protein